MKKGLDWYRRPEIVLADLLNKAARDEINQNQNIFYRAVVLAVDLDGGMLQNDNGDGSIDVLLPDGSRKSYSAIVGPKNPRGSIKARILTDGFDRLLDDSDVRVFWPFLPHDQIGIPVSPGEHVYVLFEGNSLSNGLWFSRVSGQESASNFVGKNSYTSPSNQKSAMDSFEQNTPEYEINDDFASLAPIKSAFTSFGEDS